MRRKDRERLEQAFLDDVLRRADVLHLACNTEDFPYILPLNFVTMDGALYIHCATEGRKQDCIARDNRVGFSACVDVVVDALRHTTYFKSVCGTGRAVVLTDPEEKERALQALSRKYRSQCPNPTPPATMQRTAVLRIDIGACSGKQNLPKG